MCKTLVLAMAVARPSARSRIHEPFVLQLRKSLTKTYVHKLHIVLEVPSL